jgi:hypothetical protein
MRYCGVLVGGVEVKHLIAAVHGAHRTDSWDRRVLIGGLVAAIIIK